MPLVCYITPSVSLCFFNLTPSDISDPTEGFTCLDLHVLEKNGILLFEHKAVNGLDIHVTQDNSGVAVIVFR